MEHQAMQNKTSTVDFQTFLDPEDAYTELTANLKYSVNLTNFL
jgi:hypothetical protein